VKSSQSPGCSIYDLVPRSMTFIYTTLACPQAKNLRPANPTFNTVPIRIAICERWDGINIEPGPITSETYLRPLPEDHTRPPVPARQSTKSKHACSCQRLRRCLARRCALISTARRRRIPRLGVFTIVWRVVFHC
jgi:hypothetical protein